MNEWLGFLPTLCVACALLFLPGWLQAIAIGLRGVAAVAAGPGLTLATIAVGAILLSKLGKPWGGAELGVVWIATLVIAVVINLGVRRVWKPAAWKQPTLRGLLRVVLPVLFAFAVLSFTLIRAIVRPENFSQEYDNLFHLNAVQYILETHDASSLTIGRLTSGDSAPGFYPAAWHGFVSLLVSTTGVSIPVATNATSFAVSLSWIVGSVYFATTLFGRTLEVTAVSAFAAVSFSAFPYQLLDWGPLYPLLAGIACLPAALAIALSLIEGARWEPSRRQYGPAALLGSLGIAVGIALSHPSILVFGVLLAAIAGTAQIFRLVGGTEASVLRNLLLAGGLWSFVVCLWLMVRPAYDASAWVATETLGQAIGEVLTNSPMELPPAFLMSILALAGARYAWQHQMRWLVVSHFVVGLIFVAGAAMEENWLRIFLTGVFYRDSHRLGALLVVTAMPLAVLGGVLFSRWVWKKALSLGSTLRQHAIARKLPMRLVAVCSMGAVAVVGLYVTQRGAVQGTVPGIRELFTYEADSPVLNADEKQILDDVPIYVPAGATIIDDPTTGAPFVYALTGRHVTAPHALYQPSEEVALINTSLNDPSQRESVCQAVQTISAYYVLDFGREDIYSPVDHAGIRGLEPPFVQVLDQRGGARLLQIVGC